VTIGIFLIVKIVIPNSLLKNKLERASDYTETPQKLPNLLDNTPVTPVVDSNSTQSGFDYQKEYDFYLPVDGYIQKHNLSCECASVSDALAYMGITYTEDHCLEVLPVYKGFMQNDVWGDPNQEFVGDVNGHQSDRTGYGVFPNPLYQILKMDNITSYAIYKGNITDLTKSLVNNKPVVIWIPVSFERCTDISWFTPVGNKVQTCINEHAVVLVGFKGQINQPSTMRVMDVHVGITREVDWETFKKAWEYMDRMALLF